METKERKFSKSPRNSLNLLKPQMLLSPKFILLYSLLFFIYINFKLSLLKNFIKYAKWLTSRSEEDRINAKKSKEMAQEISELELRIWYEDSVFKKVSQLEYSEKLARKRYELFLENSLQQKPSPESEDKPDDENEIKNEPLFKIKLKP